MRPNWSYVCTTLFVGLCCPYFILSCCTLNSTLPESITLGLWTIEWRLLSLWVPHLIPLYFHRSAIVLTILPGWPHTPLCVGDVGNPTHQRLVHSPLRSLYILQPRFRGGYIWRKRLSAPLSALYLSKVSSWSTPGYFPNVEIDCVISLSLLVGCTCDGEDALY